MTYLYLAFCAQHMVGLCGQREDAVSGYAQVSFDADLSQDVRDPSATQMCSFSPADVAAVLGAAACKCSFLFPVIEWHMGLSQTW